MNFVEEVIKVKNRSYKFLIMSTICVLLLCLGLAVPAGAQYYAGGYSGSLYGYGGYPYGVSSLYGYPVPPGSYPQGFPGFTIPLYNQYMYQIPFPLYLTYAQNQQPSNRLSYLARNFYTWSNFISGRGGLYGLWGGFW